MDLTKILNTERQHFNRLSPQAQRLLGAFFYFNFLLPIFTTFTNAFIWRQSESIITVAVFALAVYIMLPVGYYINGHLLKKFLSARLYLAGVLIQAIFTAAIIFSPVTNNISVSIYGALIGISAGVLWANKNLLVLRITINENRIYFASLESTINILLGIIVPLVIGTFIVFGQKDNLYTPIQAYYLLSFLVFVIIFFIFRQTKNITTKLPEINQILLKKPTKNWMKMRTFGFTFGLINGVMGFVPVVMVLLLVGHEDAVGTVQSLSAVVAAVIIYFIAKKITPQQRLWLIGGGALLSILGSLSFAILYSKFGVFIFFAFQALALPLSFISYNTLYYELIDKENENKNNHYSYIFDSEVFLNLGRVTGVLIFLGFIHFSSQAPALRYALLILAISQIILFFIAKSIEKNDKIKISTDQEQIII